MPRNDYTGIVPQFTWQLGDDGEPHTVLDEAWWGVGVGELHTSWGMKGAGSYTSLGGGGEG